jgi:hypothetical protein
MEGLKPIRVPFVCAFERQEHVRKGNMVSVSTEADRYD